MDVIAIKAYEHACSIESWYMIAVALKTNEYILFLDESVCGKGLMHTKCN